MPTKKKSPTKKRAATVRRAPDGRWLPGSSGNPHGVPGSYYDMVALARAETRPALRTVIDIMMTSTDDKTRLAAAKIILDRGWGTAPQLVQVRSEVDAPGQDVRQIEAKPPDHVIRVAQILANAGALSAASTIDGRAAEGGDEPDPH